ncbi:MAG: PIN domain-containing protein [Actinomycetaceae bacterium]|nr:PIN domain-containing protein [Actinomycetaceae bacterium]
MIRYLDTSAALKLVLQEKESSSLLDWIETVGEQGDRMISSWLMYAEMRCALQRQSHLDALEVDRVMSVVELFDILRQDFMQAPISGMGLRAADAIHLAAALRIGADAIITYDEELIARAQTIGLEVNSPGQ